MTPFGSAGRSLARREFERILLIKPSSLGDLVHALPVLHGLRRRYPAARIDWLVGDAFAPLLEGHPDVTELVRFDRRRYGKMLRNPAAGLEFASFVQRLRARNYDLVIDLQGLFRSGFLALASGAAVRIGFAAARELAWVFYTHRLPPTPTDTHAVDRNYAVADLLGFAEVPITFHLAVTDEERRQAERVIKAAGHDPAVEFAAVLPGARWETKRWPEHRFAEVIDALRAGHELPTILLAGRDEAEVCSRVQAACTGGPVNLAGRTNLRELVAVLEKAALVICHDSAPMHLAAALGRPTVCILGPTNPARTGPYGSRVAVVQEDWPCVPCYLRRLCQCQHEHRCMASLESARVLEAAAGMRRAALPVRRPDYVIGGPDSTDNMG